MNRLAYALVAGFALVALLGPAIAPYDPATLDLGQAYAAPSATHWLGTGENGVDLLSALLHGARLSAVVGLSVVLLGGLLGGALGLLAALLRGATEHAIMGAADLLQSVPAIVLNVAMLALVPRPGVAHVVLALSVNAWVPFARVARARALAERGADFVLAARASGAGDLRIARIHLLPAVLPALLVQGSAAFGAAILAEATLSFLGLGPGAAWSFGALLAQGTHALLVRPHVAMIAGATIGATVLGFNLAGDALAERAARRGR